MPEQHIDYKELGKLYKRLERVIDYFPAVDIVARRPFRAMYYADVYTRMMNLEDGGVIEELDKLDLKEMTEIEPTAKEQLDFLEGYYEK